MTAILKRYKDGTEELVARTFGVDDAGKVIDDEGNSLFDDPRVIEIVIKRDEHDEGGPPSYLLVCGAAHRHEAPTGKYGNECYDVAGRTP